MKTNRSYEILAPAGSIDAVRCMLAEGADAVYVGLQGFSSRPGYSDLPLSAISEAIQLCHSNGKKLYVAINTNISHKDIDRLLDEIYQLDAMQADAVILADIGLLPLLTGKLHYTRVHASTLMGIYNTAAVRLLKKYGVTRVIFYANQKFEEMAEMIRMEPDLEYELVAEGGTCFNDIRQCRIPHGTANGSHILYCRERYFLESASTGEAGPAHPICEPPARAAEFLGLYMAIGITSFKIEGRTVPASERVGIVRDLRNALTFYQTHDVGEAGLHYFARIRVREQLSPEGGRL